MKFHLFRVRTDTNLHSTVASVWDVVEPVTNETGILAYRWREFYGASRASVIGAYRRETGCEDDLLIVRVDDLEFHRFVHEIEGECWEDG